MRHAHAPEPVPPIQDPGVPPGPNPPVQDPVIPPDPAHPGSPPVEEPPDSPLPGKKRL